MKLNIFVFFFVILNTIEKILALHDFVELVEYSLDSINALLWSQVFKLGSHRGFHKHARFYIHSPDQIPIHLIQKLNEPILYTIHIQEHIKCYFSYFSYLQIFQFSMIIQFYKFQINRFKILLNISHKYFDFKPNLIIFKNIL